MADVDQLVEDAMESLSEVGDDTDGMTQAESAEFYEGVALLCGQRATLIREEMSQ